MFIFNHASEISCSLGSIGERFVSWNKFSKELENNFNKYPPLANSEAAQVENVGYVGDEEVEAFLSYKQGIKNQAYEGTESGALYAKIIESLSAILAKSGVKRVLNFGVCYAHIDAELAKRFPDIEFHGVDRSPYTKLLNKYEFGGITNLRFLQKMGLSLLPMVTTTCCFTLEPLWF